MKNSESDDGWFVSSFSNGKGNCVQARFSRQGEILVRDSKDRRVAPPVLTLSSPGWASLLKHLSDSA